MGATSPDDAVADIVDAAENCGGLGLLDHPLSTGTKWANSIKKIGIASNRMRIFLFESSKFAAIPRESFRIVSVRYSGSCQGTGFSRAARS